MNAIWKLLLALVAATGVGQVSAQVTFYEHNDFEGRSFTAQGPVDNFKRLGFNDLASSVVVTGRPWEVCQDVGFRGRCVVLRPGAYHSLGDMNMNDFLSSARPLGRGEARHDEDRYAPQPMRGQVTFYEHNDFQGRAFNAEDKVSDFRRYGFNDRASSVVVLGDRWEACENINFSGRCVILRPGRYPSLGSMGLNDRVSSVRVVRADARFDDHRYAPPPAPVYDWRRRPQERLFDVPVRDVHAVFAAPQQRCWIEREQVSQAQRRGPNMGGAVVGGVIGAILGHQIGDGSNRDVATVGGAVVGAAVGANVGRNATVTSTRDVQRCANVPSQEPPEYWDVSYEFRGVEHHVQTTSPPGPTLTVNERGEPRL